MRDPYDAIVIGGSYAGLAAALQLGRARRRVLVLDAGQRRNRFAAHAHGFLGFDGATPEAIAAAGRANVLAYATAELREAYATEVRAADSRFVVRTAADELHARRVILATGVADELPAIPGLAERWGRGVFHCPYCHGFELDRGRLGVLAVDALSVHQAVLASEWSAEGGTTLLTNGAFEPDADQLAQLAARRISVERTAVASVRGDRDLALDLADGRVLPLAGVFVLPRTRIADPFAAQLGCELEHGPLGAYYKTDERKETTVPGVFACGDVASPMPSVAFAVADGTRAGVCAHQSLVFRAS
jgi:thioredoxin reductase